MAWRGAHIGGDNTRLRAGLWGGGSVLTFLVALLIGAMGNHDANKQIQEAQAQAQSLKNQLSSIQTGISALQAVVAPTGGSIDQTLLAAIAKIQNQQSQINSLGLQVGQLTNESRSPMDVYQSGIDVGKVGSSTFDQNTKVLTFGYITTSQPIDFSIPLEFRHFLFLCKSAQPSGITAFGAVQNDTYNNLQCSLIGNAPP